ncbi:hypothetical protein L210DRAFT_3507607 [Boletus edulis BED1]|uniref:Uncharacterized protein n=1 Tax=Boletus edulis BED1 TaxID=1328754 RepID=A0AAD4BIR2_BOLED|nr:hypothetical protein L210DRAFT_3507607 [Boletus edulis BED1]
MVEYPGSIVSEWVRSLNNFFYSEDQCEMAIQALREMRRVAKMKRSLEEFRGYIVSCGFAKVILMVEKGWMEIAKQLEFMQGSFRRHQWREALLICLTQLTLGLVPKPMDTILEEMKELMDSTTQTQGSQVSARQLLLLIMFPLDYLVHFKDQGNEGLTLKIEKPLSKGCVVLESRKGSKGNITAIMIRSL